MTEIEAGHQYILRTLDADHHGSEVLTFVKRDGPGYPGNVGHHPGTTLQEVLRACIARVQYLDSQIPCPENDAVLLCLRHAILALESRAALRHGRFLQVSKAEGIEQLPVCPKCLHIGCPGDCHEDVDKNEE